MSNDFDIGTLRAALVERAVPDDAAPMAAYMKHRFEFLGLKTPARRAAVAPTLAAAKHAPADELLDFARSCWAQPEREFHYVGADALKAGHTQLDPDDLEDVAALITTHSWWDTVDTLASWPVGSIVMRHPETVAVMDAWIHEPNFWLARTAILHQLRFKGDTDVDRLFRYALTRSGDAEFFIRKAIGWSLRQYAHHSPDRVADFVAEHEHELSPLSVREALKNIS